MKDYYIFLRGINVGGNKKVPMGDLKKMLIEQGYTEVKTYLNSGNIRLKTKEQDSGTLERTISGLLEKTFGFPVPVVVRQGERMATLFNENPFAGKPEDKKLKWMITFLKTPVNEHPEIQLLEGYSVIHRDRDIVGGILDLNQSGSVDAMSVLEKAYGREITTRTWQTLLRMQS